ncbi:MAG TPA: hypothetical protein VKA53_00605 [Thermoanaerobaculia bacterium]|nr:hypothetical protein [Thermoanaerobaculia bacterium]
MSGKKLIAVILLVAGILALVYGGFTYTKSSHEAKIGSLEVSLQQKKHVNIPVWGGVVAVIAGALLLASSGKRN